MKGIRRLAGVSVIALASAAGWALGPAATHAASPPEVSHQRVVHSSADLGVGVQPHTRGDDRLIVGQVI
jgi:hypothetical protein